MKKTVGATASSASRQEDPISRQMGPEKASIAPESAAPSSTKAPMETRAMRRTSCSRPSARRSATILDTATGSPAEEITYMAV